MLVERSPFCSPGQWIICLRQEMLQGDAGISALIEPDNCPKVSVKGLMGSSGRRGCACFIPVFVLLKNCKEQCKIMFFQWDFFFFLVCELLNFIVLVKVFISQWVITFCTETYL